VFGTWVLKPEIEVNVELQEHILSFSSVTVPLISVTGFSVLLQGLPCPEGFGLSQVLVFFISPTILVQSQGENPDQGDQAPSKNWLVSLKVC
jgi:hypothetical protein